MGETTFEEMITFNGINGATGDYLTNPMPVKHLVKLVKRQSWEKDHWNDLIARVFSEQDSLRVLPQYGDGSDLNRVGWGLIFPAGAGQIQVEAILSALDGLIQLRREQAGKKFKIFRGQEGFQWKNGKPETKNEFLVRHGASPGPADPNFVPFYLLIVADPQSIPFNFQYELDIQYAVGRIYFSTLEEFSHYAQSVVEAETGKVSLARRAVFFGVANPGDNATTLSANYLVKPLSELAKKDSDDAGLGWSVELVNPEDADRETLKSLLGGNQTPAFLFTASHGMSWPYLHKLQNKNQGALVCQDWKGFAEEKVGRQHYLSAEDIPDNHSLSGSIIFNFACFGGGTPYWDEIALAKNQGLVHLAHRPFLSALPLRLLGHPNGGALAVIGHIERAWAYSFRWEGLKSQTQHFQSMIYQLMDGKRIGLAMDEINVRYAEIATMLANDLTQIKYDPQAINAYELAYKWTANNDARGYAILGDPAVRVPTASPKATGNKRSTNTLNLQFSGILPVVFANEALAPLNETEKQIVKRENEAQQKYQRLTKPDKEK